MITIITSIKGVHSSVFFSKDLRKLVSKLKIKHNNNTNKITLLKLLEKKKLSSSQHSNLYRDDNINEEEVEVGDKNKKKGSNKGKRPTKITSKGSLYRVILTYFLQDMWEFVKKIATNPEGFELNVPCTHHERCWNMLSGRYNDPALVDLNTFDALDNVFVSTGINGDKSTMYDKLTGATFSATMVYFNKIYRGIYNPCNKSGNHQDFGDYCQNRPYTFLYHSNLLEIQDCVLTNLAYPQLPDGVKRGTHNDITTSLNDRKRVQLIKIIQQAKYLL